MDYKKRVKKWLVYCDNNDTEPWEFDFKLCDGENWLKKDDDDSNFSKCIITGDATKYATSNLRLEIAYRSANYHKAKNKIKVLPQGKGDCDKKAIPMYDILGWQESKALTPDTMNSFQTTFTPLMNVNVNEDKNKQLCSTINSPFSIENNQIWKNEFKKDSIPDLYTELVKWADEEIDQEETDQEETDQEETDQEETDQVRDNLKAFIKPHYKCNDKVDDFLDDLEKFAKLTNSIGNFIVLPSWMNTGRAGGNIRDYWDLTLRDLRDFFFEIDHEHGVIVWNQFIEKYYLQPFVDEDYVPKELWKGHFENGVMPKKIEDFKKFYENVNLLIEERGKKITEELYKEVYSSEELKEYALYQTELANFEPRDFNKIMKAKLPLSKKY